jgi:DNA-binding transcriptional ArsR family regulator
MPSTPPIAEIAALVANPGRANMLAALLDGRALTAGDLAFAAHVTPQTASGYLVRMTQARLLVLEAIMAVAAEAPSGRRPWRGEETLRAARTCYDHLAGRLGVALADSMIAHGRILLGEDGGQVTSAGAEFLSAFGLDLAGPSRRAFCRPCLDWSERRPHLAGRVGAALASRCLDLGWLRRLPDTRALAITPEGRRGFSKVFGLEAV